MTAEELAQLFHETYTRLAMQHNKEALDEQTVLAVCREILKTRVLVDRNSTPRGFMKYGGN